MGMSDPIESTGLKGVNAKPIIPHFYGYQSAFLVFSLAPDWLRGAHLWFWAPDWLLERPLAFRLVKSSLWHWILNWTHQHHTGLQEVSTLSQRSLRGIKYPLAFIPSAFNWRRKPRPQSIQEGIQWIVCGLCYRLFSLEPQVGVGFKLFMFRFSHFPF